MPVAAALISAAASAYAAKQTADAAESGSKRSTELQGTQFERGIREVRPFKKVGLDALYGLDNIANNKVKPFQFRAPGAFLNNYFDTPEYQTLNTEAQDQILRNNSMTGGIRNGGTNVDLAKIAPTLGLNALDRVNQQDLQAYGVNQGALSDQFNRLYSLGSMGANVASGNQVAGANFGSAAGQNAITAGMAQGNSYSQQADSVRGLGVDLATIYANKGQGGGLSSGVSNQYTGSEFSNWVAQQRGKL